MLLAIYSVHNTDLEIYEETRKGEKEASEPGEQN